MVKLWPGTSKVLGSVPHIIFFSSLLSFFFLLVFFLGITVLLCFYI